MLLRGLTAALAALALSLPVALAAGPAHVAPGQRVDLRVLLISADGTEPGFGAWKAALDREGVPYDALVATQAAPLSDAQLADYGAGHARYQAVILAGGDLGTAVRNPGGTTSFLSAFSDAEWATLAKFERTFGIRQLSDYTAPSPAHGLTPVAGATTDGQVGTLTAAGRAAFPYLKGPVAIADDDPTAAETFGYAARPADPAAWQTLLAGPGDTAYLGVYTHPDDGREELVMTVASNQFQNHDQLLRHGMLNWVTRGVYLGYERNYLELDVDDIFLPDDKWDSVANVTDYRPEVAIRMTAADVANAVAWQRQTGLRMNLVYNMGGLAEFGGGDLLAALKANRNEFRWINHTLQHPNLDCATGGYIAGQFTANQAQFDAQFKPGLAAGLNEPSELVTGEHSGLANTRPGNPGTLDPPVFSDAEPSATGGTLAAGTYEYGVTASTAAGETPASVTQVAVTGATSSVELRWPTVCWATSYRLYRRPVGGAWSLVADAILPPSPAFTDAGAADVSFVDTGTAGTAAAPPTANGAALAPYRQNPAFAGALSAAGIRTVASDASKAYPNPPGKDPVSEADPTNFPKGATFAVGSAQAVPRYPSNVYYNVANRADQLDEYNWIYTAPPVGGCVPIAGVTTCNPAEITWPQYLERETRIMFGHLVGNDPRPHYFHQTNIAQSDLGRADTDTTVGGTLYAVVNTLLRRYDAAYDRGSAPIVQLTHTQIAQTLVQQSAWAGARANVSAWVQDGRVYVPNAGTAPVAAPLTGTTEGADYGGQRSGWVTVAPGAAVSAAPLNPANTAAPGVAGTARVGETLSASPGAWTGSPSLAYQWQRCAAACTNIDGATSSKYELGDADRGLTVRVAVLAGNWVSSVSQAVSAPSEKVAARPVRSADPPRDTPRGEGERGAPPRSAPRVALKLTKLKMSPRRFAVAHKRLPRGTKLDGSRISWSLSRAARVRLVFQRHTRSGWRRVGVITRAGKAGAGEVRFRGRFGRKLLAPRRYRVVVSASGGGERTPARRLSFRVIR
jgi:hypothetical protein